MSERTRKTLACAVALGTAQVVGLGLVGGVLWKQPAALGSRLLPCVCLLLAAILAAILRRRDRGAVRGRQVGALALAAGLAAGTGLLSKGWPSSILSILSLVAALGAVLAAIWREAGSRRPHSAEMALPLLGAVQIGLMAGWLLTRGRSAGRLLAADQTALSLVILAMVGELLLFRRWKEGGGRGDGRPTASVVWLGNARAWGLIPLAAVLLLMTMSREDAQFGVAALVLVLIGQGIWQWLALVVGQRRVSTGEAKEPQTGADGRNG